MSANLQRAFPSPGPRLVPAAPPRHDLLTLWHVLSLDAPTVATLWTFFIARSSHLSIPWQGPAAMFLAVWMLYVADRLLDARSEAEPLEERHRFHRQHASAFLAATCLAAPALATLLFQLPAAPLRLYALLAALLAAWLLLVHARPHPALQRLPKEFAVGIFFPAATFIPTVARIPALRLPLLPAALDFAALCTLNCLFVYRWEHSSTRHAHATTRFATKHLRLASLLTIFASLVLAVFLPDHAIPLACALSTALLLVLDHIRYRITRTHLRALADAALLTPLALLPWLR